jgi:hypothetical protein
MQMLSSTPHKTAQLVLTLLDERNARLYTDRKAFYVWPREGRLMIIFDPSVVDGGKINEEFAHRLSTRIQGRLVLRTNSRGLFLQIADNVPPAPVELTAQPLDLTTQPSPFHMPIGETARGALWVSLTKGDSFLVAGTRNFGKSGILQGWVQALLHGGQTLVYAYDGKGGTEFVRYIGSDNFHYISNLKSTLLELFTIADERRRMLIRSGFQNVQSYNAANPAAPLMPIALVIDEASLATDEEREMLVRLVEKERFTGFHPVYGTNRPTAAVLLVKSNLATRVCLPVPSWNDSLMVIGMKGAERLEKVTGRGLIVYQARVTEFQSFLVSWVEPTAQAKAFIDAQSEDIVESTADAPLIVPTADEDETARILELAEAGKAESVIIRELFGVTGGGSYYKRQKQVRAVLGQKVTSSSTSTPDFGSEVAFQGA